MKRLDLETLWYERERQELLRAYEAIHGSTMGRIIPHDLPRPKLSDVLRCARLAKADSQIWEEAQRVAYFTDEQFENDESILLTLVSRFKDWFLLKNRLYDHDATAFIRICPALRALARSEFDGDEVAALRYFLEIYPGKIFIDDLTNDTPHREGAS